MAELNKILAAMRNILAALSTGGFGYINPKPFS
jgi:hypothetical protein